MIPRILATILVLPLLTIYTDVLGILGGFPVMRSMGFSFQLYYNSVASSLQLQDAVGGIVKTIAFAFLIAFAGCQRGISTDAGPAGVGRAATRARRPLHRPHPHRRCHLRFRLLRPGDVMQHARRILSGSPVISVDRLAARYGEQKGLRRCHLRRPTRGNLLRRR